MGADGHVAIYDWTKTIERFPELEKDKELCSLVKGYAYVYKNPVGDGLWLVVYWGDNLLSSTFPGYEVDLWAINGGASKSKIERAKEIVSWMNHNAVIVHDWEVWT